MRVVAVVNDQQPKLWLDLVLPYAVKVFHWTFIPAVVLLGMRTEPRPKFSDLLSPI